MNVSDIRKYLQEDLDDNTQHLIEIVYEIRKLDFAEKRAQTTSAYERTRKNAEDLWEIISKRMEELRKVRDNLNLGDYEKVIVWFEHQEEQAHSGLIIHKEQDKKGRGPNYSGEARKFRQEATRYERYVKHLRELLQGRLT